MVTSCVGLPKIKLKLAFCSDFHFPEMSQALDFAHVFGNWGGLVEIWTKGGNKQVLKA